MRSDRRGRNAMGCFNHELPVYASPFDSGICHFFPRNMILLGRQAQQGLERRHRCVPAVKAEYKFIKVMSQVFGIYAVMSAIEPGFEIAEGAVDMQSVGFGVV